MRRVCATRTRIAARSSCAGVKCVRASLFAKKIWIFGHVLLAPLLAPLARLRQHVAHALRREASRCSASVAQPVAQVSAYLPQVRRCVHLLAQVAAFLRRSSMLSCRRLMISRRVPRSLRRCRLHSLSRRASPRGAGLLREACTLWAAPSTQRALNREVERSVDDNDDRTSARRPPVSLFAGARAVGPCAGRRLRTGRIVHLAHAFVLGRAAADTAGAASAVEGEINERVRGRKGATAHAGACRRTHARRQMRAPAAFACVYTS